MVKAEHLKLKLSKVEHSNDLNDLIWINTFESNHFDLDDLNLAPNKF